MRIAAEASTIDGIIEYQPRVRLPMQTRDVEIVKLHPPVTRDVADPAKLARHGPFDWTKYTPIIVEQDGARLTIQDGMTRVENARRSGIGFLPAYVFQKR
jgi:hypothetical protein